MQLQTPHGSLSSRHVAVIGAGASGLVAARELTREGHRVAVFEKDEQVGGMWAYTPRVEPDPLGLDPSRPIVHTSLYQSLRTNLPRESMGFFDYPFLTREDPRRFPGHREVLLYLQDFAREFGVQEMVRLGHEVVSVELVGEEEDDSITSKGKWQVKCKNRNNEFVEEFFDAVVVCSGHHTQPRIAEFPGYKVWPGKQIHSHNYRTPEPFRNKVVIMIGSSSSAADLSIEISEVAKEVHMASRAVPHDKYEKQPGYSNLWLHSMIKSAHEDGSVVFQNGRIIHPDIILHCTGYNFHFPFLKTNGILTVDDNRVGPLYKHSFPFPTFESQSKWVAAVLSGRVVLPSSADMMEDVNTHYSTLEASGIPKHYTHKLLSANDYNSWLAAQCQCPCFEEWRKQMFIEVSKNWHIRPRTYHDEWEDDDLVLQAHQDFSRYTSRGLCNGSLSE
ncbi:hypothetical protein Tsubulata_005402 [Turnera subulata]|uniref:Flavin-containing monooxygenase n=1 Tax=Turnera subulata TaxID=218843 RepID=A0A9Q0G3S0_9ROSI|nr:hypothetical protein Tsubulata_005402 [Turnera subulata]